MLIGIGLLLAALLELRDRSGLVRIAMSLYCGATVALALHIGPEMRFAHVATVSGQFGTTPVGDTVQIRGLDYSVASDSTRDGLVPLAALLWLSLSSVVRAKWRKTDASINRV